jgi:hypothetical protein
MSYEKNVPRGFKRLPLELQRSHQYPRNPEASTAAMQEYVDGGTPPVYLPQNMAFNRWKTPPWKQAWMSGIIALMRAKQQEALRMQQMRSIGRYGSPRQTVHQAAEQYNEMPLPLDQVNPNIDQPVIAQSVANPRDMMSADEVSDLGRQYDNRIQQASEEIGSRAASAQQEIQSQVAQFEDFVTAPQPDEPWFRKRVSR